MGYYQCSCGVKEQTKEAIKNHQRELNGRGSSGFHTFQYYGNHPHETEETTLEDWSGGDP